MSVSVLDPRLVNVFSAVGWRRFMERLAEYRNRGQALPASVFLGNVSEDERRGYARILRMKRVPDGPDLLYRLPKLTEALANQEIAVDWEALVMAIVGPPPDDTVLSQQQQAAWGEFTRWAAAFVATQPFPHAEVWLQSLLKDGALLRLSKGDASTARERLQWACHLLAHLPLKEDEPLPSVAARLCGDAHALDPASPLHALIVRSLAQQMGQPVPERSDERRHLFERFGIICDDLSAPVLTLNLGLTGDSWLCRLVGEASAASQPLHLTNRMLSKVDWNHVTCPTAVFICENPTIVSLAAVRLGARCPPLICVNGEPRSTSRRLLRRLGEGKSNLFYHGDFDWPGVAIGARIIGELGAKPWLFAASDYAAAIRGRKSRALNGTAVATPWSPSLSELMLSEGVAVDEEVVADSLLQSLAERTAAAS